MKNMPCIIITSDPHAKTLIGSSVAPWVSSEQGPDQRLVWTWWEYSWPCMFESQQQAYIDLFKITQGAARGVSQDEATISNKWDREWKVCHASVMFQSHERPQSSSTTCRLNWRTDAPRKFFCVNLLWPQLPFQHHIGDILTFCSGKDLCKQNHMGLHTFVRQGPCVHLMTSHRISSRFFHWTGVGKGTIFSPEKWEG